MENNINIQKADEKISASYKFISKTTGEVVFVTMKDVVANGLPIDFNGDDMELVD